AFCREYRIIADDIHAESFGTFDNLAADTTHANDAKHLVAKLYAEERLAVPFAGNCLLVGLRNVASNSHHHRESMLASRNRVAVRRVDDYDPEACCRIQLDIVDANACAAYGIELLSGLHNLCFYFRLTSDEH